MSTLRITGYHDVFDGLRNRALRQALYDAGAVVMADCLLNLHGTEHRDRRRVENRLFRRETFDAWERDVLESTIDTTLAPFLAAGGGDLVDIGYRLAMHLTATVAGIDIDPRDRHAVEDLLRIVAKLSEGATMAHTTRDPAEVTAEVETALDILRADFLEPAIARRHTEPRADVLSRLLDARRALAMDDDTLLREIAFYLQAGAHSTANTLVHAFEQLWSWCDLDPDRVRRAASDRSLVQRIVFEALRLHPASPVALRRAVDATEVAGRSVAAGDLVEFDLVAANRDVAVFGPDASRFDPNRDLPPRVMPWGHSFGGGIHSCIGRELDGGIPASEHTADHQLWGTLVVMLDALVSLGFRPDPSRPPEPLATSERAHHGTFHVIIADNEAA